MSEDTNENRATTAATAQAATGTRVLTGSVSGIFSMVNSLLSAWRRNADSASFPGAA